MIRQRGLFRTLTGDEEISFIIKFIVRFTKAKNKYSDYSAFRRIIIKFIPD